MSSTKSMTEVAYELLSKKKRPIPFAKLWADVSKACNVSNDLVATFYSDLSLDSRFTSLKENKWDLTERRKFAESHIDIDNLGLEDEEDEVELDEDGEPIETMEDEY